LTVATTTARCENGRTDYEQDDFLPHRLRIPVCVRTYQRTRGRGTACVTQREATPRN